MNKIEKLIEKYEKERIHLEDLKKQVSNPINREAIRGQLFILSGFIQDLENLNSNM
jgi:hypothetical protein